MGKVIVISDCSGKLDKMLSLPELKVRQHVLDSSFMLTKFNSWFNGTIDLIWVFDNINLLYRLKFEYSNELTVFVTKLNMLYPVYYILKNLGIDVDLEPIDNYDVVTYICKNYRVDRDECTTIARHYNYNIKLIMSNDEIIAEYILGTSGLVTKKVDTNYTHVLYYLCGDSSIDQETYINTLHKYSHSYKHLVKFLLRYINLYIKVYYDEVKLGSKESDSSDVRIIRKMSDNLNVDDAMILSIRLKNKTITDLLRWVK